MGNLVPAKRTLRAWGALDNLDGLATSPAGWYLKGAMDNLDGKGMIRITVATKKDSTSKSWVYEVTEHRLKLLLRDKDVEIILFSAERRKPTKEERNGHFFVEKNLVSCHLALSEGQLFKA